MRGTFRLFLPALLPSWRFFDSIAASPRIEVNWKTGSEDGGETWQELRARPSHLGVKVMLKRLFWNPKWNEALFLVSCAERLMEAPTDHSYQEILRRVIASPPPDPDQSYVQFRLVFVKRVGDILERDVTYISEIHSLAEPFR